MQNEIIGPFTSKKDYYDVVNILRKIDETLEETWEAIPDGYNYLGFANSFMQYYWCNVKPSSNTKTITPEAFILTYLILGAT